MADNENENDLGHTHKGTAGGILGKKIGPLPVVGWIVVIVGAYLLYQHLHNKGKSTTGASGTIAASNNAASNNAPIFSPTGSIYTPTSGLPIGKVVGSTASSSSIQSGQTWAAKIQTALQGIGYTNTQIDKALKNYLAGNRLHPLTFNIIESGIKLVGHPPATFGVPAKIKNVHTPSHTTKGKTLQPPPGIIGKIIATIDQPNGGKQYVTTMGNVYAVGGAQYFGGTSSGLVGGPLGAHIVHATIAPNGGYTLINAKGDKYTFSSKANYAPGGNAYKPAYGNA